MERFSSNPIKSPEGWVETTLGEILFESKEKFSPNKSSNKKYIGLEHIGKDTGSLNGYGNSSETLSTKNIFNNGDLLYGKLRPYLNKAAVPDFDGVCSTDILVFKKHDHLFNNFIKYRLLSRDFVNFAQLNVSGVQHPRINKKLIDTFSIYFPSLAEQHAIVEKIEELFSELDNGVESLKKAREQLKTYRQAVLKYAFEGKLTQEWREQQIEAGNLPEPAEKLLERIQKEREVHYQKQVKEWKKACEQAEKVGSKKHAKPRKPKALPPLTEKELAELSELPEGWGWCYPESVCSTENYSIGIGPFGSNLKVADYKSEGIPLIFVKHITNENFSINQKYVSKEKFQELIPHSVKPLDILITKMGDPPGDCTIYPENKSIAILTADCLKFRVWEKFADRRYVMNCLKNVYVKKQLGLITKGVAQKKISTERFKTLKLPITNLNEQQAIVSEIETRLSVCDKLEQTIEDSLKKAEALRQSILKKAFEGELTREWRLAHPELISGENSAASLLARIREEKESLRKNSPQRLKVRRGKTKK